MVEVRENEHSVSSSLFCDLYRKLKCVCGKVRTLGGFPC